MSFARLSDVQPRAPAGGAAPNRGYMSVFGDWMAAAVRLRRGAAPQHRASGHEAYCISHGSVLILSVLLLPQSSFAADKRGDQRAQTPAIREHPGGLIQSQWLERGAVKDDAGKELGKLRKWGSIQKTIG